MLTRGEYTLGPFTIPASAAASASLRSPTLLPK